MEKCAVFTDMSGFTEAMRSSQSQEFISQILQFRQIAEQSAHAHNGQLTHHAGDSTLSLFNNGKDAMYFINDVKSQFTQNEVNFGTDCGKIVQIGDDYFGLAINVASKLGEDIAQRGQVLVTEKICGDLFPMIINKMITYCDITSMFPF